MGALGGRDSNISVCALEGYKPEQLFEGVEGLPSPCSVQDK